MTVFPRPKKDWRIYTHALDRDSLLTERKEYRRFDQQLIRMIDDARTRLRSDGYRFDKRVLMFGFSASGMFTNRFTFLHPERIKAAAIGSPGGWAMAPIDSWKDTALSNRGCRSQSCIGQETGHEKVEESTALFVSRG